MAIYHMQAKVVSRGSGRSAVAASAYMSCSRIYNDYDGIQHDYTRKHGLIYQEVMLSPIAPSEYSCAMKSHFRKFGNQMSGSGNHLCKYTSLLA